jgi:hypothetical protein
MRSISSSFVDKGTLRALLKDLLLEQLGITQLSRNQLRIMTGLSTGHYHLK